MKNINDCKKKWLEREICSTNKDKLCEERATIYPFVGRARGLYGEREEW